MLFCLVLFCFLFIWTSKNKKKRTSEHVKNKSKKHTSFTYLSSDIYHIHSFILWGEEVGFLLSISFISLRRRWFSCSSVWGAGRGEDTNTKQERKKKKNAKKYSKRTPSCLFGTRNIIVTWCRAYRQLTHLLKFNAECTQCCTLKLPLSKETNTFSVKYPNNLDRFERTFGKTI